MPACVVIHIAKPGHGRDASPPELQAVEAWTWPCPVRSSNRAIAPPTVRPRRRTAASGTRSSATEFVAGDDAALHHEPHPLHLGDVGERVAGHRDQVRELAFLDAANLVTQL